WHVKMNDADIVARWAQEAAEYGMTEAEIRYVLAELAYYAERRDERTGIEVSGVDGVWQSDVLIDDELRSRLREAVRVLEDVSDAERDWHPGSDEQVLDLVHPSLFCLVRGVSRPDDGTWPSLGEDEARYTLSDKFSGCPRTSRSARTAMPCSSRMSTISTLWHIASWRPSCRSCSGACSR